jgi:sulfite reductase (NADPH) flavoprotein alpha-component
MLRKLVFQLHWLLGITAGLVLAVVGVTGAMLSFEDPLLEAINPGVMTVPARPAPLPPAALLARIGEQWPERSIQSLSLSADPEASARVVFAPLPAPDGAAPGGRARGEQRYVDPYTGALLPPPRGQGFFRTTMQVHRWLAADAVGKQIVGASTLALVFFCLSGLYLRWPRRWASLRAWFHLDTALTGRRFLWHLHSVVGTWLLLPCLVMALSGLHWSYGWYREGLLVLSGTPAPAMRGGAREASAAEAAPAAAIDFDRAHEAILVAVPAWSSLTLRLPTAAGQPLEVSYLDAAPAHERAGNRLLLDPVSLAVTAHERHAEKPFGQRLLGAIFPLHSGSYFGPVGLWVFFVASLGMPLFTITGLQLYLDRRAKKREGEARRRQREQARAAKSAG